MQNWHICVEWKHAGNCCYFMRWSSCINTNFCVLLEFATMYTSSEQRHFQCLNIRVLISICFENFENRDMS
jgi:hypothetical protein